LPGDLVTGTKRPDGKGCLWKNREEEPEEEKDCRRRLHAAAGGDAVASRGCRSGGDAPLPSPRRGEAPVCPAGAAQEIRTASHRCGGTPLRRIGTRRAGRLPGKDKDNCSWDGMQERPGEEHGSWSLQEFRSVEDLEGTETGRPLGV